MCMPRKFKQLYPLWEKPITGKKCKSSNTKERAIDRRNAVVSNKRFDEMPHRESSWTTAILIKKQVKRALGTARNLRGTVAKILSTFWSAKALESEHRQAVAKIHGPSNILIREGEIDSIKQAKGIQ